MIDISKVNKIYFIGIGGIGMSAAACLFKVQGFDVSGSDNSVYEPSLTVLEENNIEFVTGYNADNVDLSADLFVVTSAVDNSNPEVALLESKGLSYVSFPESLAALFAEKIKVVVSGTHGKSTTSALIGFLLSNIDQSGYLVGAVLQNTGNNFAESIGAYTVFEGDEYKSLWDDYTPKMHYYKPDIAVLTNLEFDHPDMYASLEDIKQEFSHLIDGLPEDGLVVYNADDVNLNSIVHQTSRHNFSFGFDEGATIQIIEYENDDGGTLITINNKLDKNNTKIEKYHTSLFGKLYVYNVAAAIATLRVLGFSPELIDTYLKTFTGTKRRLELIKDESFYVYDDYAHHPTEVKNTIEALRGHYPDKRIWAVFEPHTFSRTNATYLDLVRSFESADVVVLSDVYNAREKKHEGDITSSQIIDQIQGKEKYLVHSKQEAFDLIKNNIKSGDVVVVMAVGDFNRLAYEL